MALVGGKIQIRTIYHLRIINWYDRLHSMIKKEPIPSGMSPLKESDSFYLFFTFIHKKTATKAVFPTRLTYLRYA